MILGLAFSKDRALQLEACLASLALHVPDLSSLETVVVYSASSARFRAQYEELARWYEGRARFVEEEDFRTQVLRLLGSAATTGSKAPWPLALRRFPASAHEKVTAQEATDWILFLVDDTIFVRHFSLDGGRAALQRYPDALGLSLRLGRNTDHCYVLRRQQLLPEFAEAGNGMLRYKWAEADGDFAYPLELSSSLYRLRDIVPLVGGLAFTDPNTLESQMAVKARRFSRSHPYMLCLESSVAFSAPVNRVQRIYENRSGVSPALSTEGLAATFDRGLRIDVASMSGFVPSACHQEVEFSFAPRIRHDATR